MSFSSFIHFSISFFWFKYSHNCLIWFSIRLDDYNVKIKQIENHIKQLCEYLNQKKEIEKWIKEENDMMLGGITFGFDSDKKFYFGIHNYSIR
jgi:hypothetical protein